MEHFVGLNNNNCPLFRSCPRDICENGSTFPQSINVYKLNATESTFYDATFRCGKICKVTMMTAPIVRALFSVNLEKTEFLTVSPLSIQ